MENSRYPRRQSINRRQKGATTRATVSSIRRACQHGAAARFQDVALKTHGVKTTAGHGFVFDPQHRRQVEGFFGGVDQKLDATSTMVTDSS